jgi:sn-glycerol 3-phosphate transport system ATP-binding protein
VSITLRGVAKRFGGVVALESTDLEVADGELLVLLGPSGCGKSTTLRIVAGLEEPSAGDVSIDGKRVNDVPPQDRDVAMVFQGYALYPHLTVRQNIAFPLARRGVARTLRDERVVKTARTLGLEALLDRRPGELSGGERQRVAMGRALVRQPRVFLFDEPLSNLDARLRGELRGEVARLHRSSGTSSLYVTHDQVEAMALGDRIAVLETGRITQVAPPRIVYERPATRFVASFVGTPAINLLPAHRGEAALAAGPLRWSPPPPGRDRLEAGIRPEDLRIETGVAEVNAVVDRVELAGAEAHLFLVPLSPADGWTEGPTSIVARVAAARAPAPGEKVRVSAALDRVHWFDPASGARVEA